MLTIRPELPQDRAAVGTVHRLAFPTDAEARLVDTLRDAGKAVVSLVAEQDGRVVGHVLFSPVTVEAGTSAAGVGLAPVAVLPEHQSRGVGTALIRAGLERCREAGYGFAVVLGHEAYYPRFGFRRASLAGLGNEYGADEHFMVLELRPGALAGARGLVRYAAEFAQLEG
jgi:putative acetyltransferase